VLRAGDFVKLWDKFMIVLAAAVFGNGCSGGTAEDAYVEQARSVHRNALTIDAHVEIPGNYATSEVDPITDNDFQVDFPKLRAGELEAVFLVIDPNRNVLDANDTVGMQAATIRGLEAINRLAEEMHPSEIEIARSVDEIERIVDSGKFAASIGIENGLVVGEEIGLIETYFEYGGRYMALPHDIHVEPFDVEDVSGDDFDGKGLAPLAPSIIDEMNRLGMAVDISHLSRTAMLEAVSLSQAPVIASNSAIRKLRNHSWNLDDDQLIALRENGGVVQVVAFGALLTDDAALRRREYNNIRGAFGMIPGQQPEELGAEPYEDYIGRMEALDDRYPAATVSDFVDHIDYAVGLIGIDHVGISSDFDGGGGISGWNHAGETLNVTVELIRRGYSESEIAKLWGGNLLRVLREVESVAGR
jgi:membrane dipeptidase|tara:strand:+ start:665 stop:1912 length:1248 start_codon:yes stop_codon:yes gene_type:complete